MPSQQLREGLLIDMNGYFDMVSFSGIGSAAVFVQSIRQVGAGLPDISNTSIGVFGNNHIGDVTKRNGGGFGQFCFSLAAATYQTNPPEMGQRQMAVALRAVHSDGYNVMFSQSPEWTGEAHTGEHRGF